MDAYINRLVNFCKAIKSVVMPYGNARGKRQSHDGFGVVNGCASVVAFLIISGVSLSATAQSVTPNDKLNNKVNNTARNQSKNDNGLKYDYGEVRIVNFDIRGTDGDGIEFSGSFKLEDRIYIAGVYDDWETDNGTDFTLYLVGAGYIVPVETFDLSAQLSILEVETDPGSSDSGYQLGFGARGYLQDNLEGFASINYRDVKNSDTFMRVGFDYLVTPTLSGGLLIDLIGDIDTVSFGVRYHFL